MLLIGGAIVVIVALLLGIGWYQSYIAPYRQTVLTVGNRHATLDYFIKRLKEVLPQFQNSDPQVVVSVVPEATRDEIENDFVVLQRAEQNGATATDDEIDDQAAIQLGIPATQGSKPARATLEAALTDRLGKTGLTLGEFREHIRAQVLASKIQQKLGGEYPRTGPEAKYEEIIMNDQPSAKKILDRLNGGESWESLVAEVHGNPTQGTVAQFDFQPKLQIDDKLVDPLFALNPGGHTDVVATGDGRYTIARLIDKDDQHPISDDQVQAITPKLYAQWLDEQKKTLPIKEQLSDAQKAFAIKHSDYTPAPPSKQTVPQQVNPVPAQPAQPSFNPANLPAGISTPAGGFGNPAAPPAGAPSGP